MHTCYSLVTNEGSQALILKSLPSLGLLHSLALERCFSAEQMSKITLKEVEKMYLYTPQLNPTVTSQLSKTRTDRTRWSTWPDAPVKCNGWKPERNPWVTGRTDQGIPDVSDRARTLLYFNLTLDRVRSVMTGRVRSAKYLTGTWPNAFGHFLVAFDYTVNLWNTCQTDQHVRSSQGPRLVNQVKNAVTVSTDRARPVMTETASGKG
jgi:hypothetical protein